MSPFKVLSPQKILFWYAIFLSVRNSSPKQAHTTPRHYSVLVPKYPVSRITPYSFLRNRLKQVNDAAVKHLSSLRALYRLSLGSGGGGVANPGFGRGDTGVFSEGTSAASAADPHPHLTALATVLGEGSKLMARLAESSLGQGVEEPVVQLLHDDSKAQVCTIYFG